jgi:hypothetical protein
MELNTSHLSPQRLRQLKMGAIFVGGACLPLLSSALVRGVGVVADSSGTWRDFGAAGAAILTVLLTLIACYRLVRKSTLPGIPMLALLVALMWANILL